MRQGPGTQEGKTRAGALKPDLTEGAEKRNGVEAEEVKAPTRLGWYSNTCKVWGMGRSKLTKELAPRAYCCPRA